MPEKKSASKQVIHARIIPLAELRKRLASAETATAEFVDGRSWSEEDAAEHRRLIIDELDAVILLKDRDRLGK
jgi:hypothetical protein